MTLALRLQFLLSVVVVVAADKKIILIWHALKKAFSSHLHATCSNHHSALRHLLCRLFCAFWVYLYRRGCLRILYDYKTQNLNHTFNGPSKIQLKLFCCHQRTNTTTTQPQHNNTTTLTKTVLITTTTHDDKINHTIFPLSLHLFCWNLTQHHWPRPVVLSVSLK